MFLFLQTLLLLEIWCLCKLKKKNPLVSSVFIRDGNFHCYMKNAQTQKLIVKESDQTKNDQNLLLSIDFPILHGALG